LFKLQHKQMPESSLQHRIRLTLQAEFGGFWFKTHGSPYQPKGLPDLLGCIPCEINAYGAYRFLGIYVGLEVKLPGEELEPIQQERSNQIQDAGGIAGRVDSPAQAIRLVREALAAAGLRPRLPAPASPKRRRRRIV
jgi:hypothetical protein